MENIQQIGQIVGGNPFSNARWISIQDFLKIVIQDDAATPSKQVTNESGRIYIGDYRVILYDIGVDPIPLDYRLSGICTDAPQKRAQRPKRSLVKADWEALDFVKSELREHVGGRQSSTKLVERLADILRYLDETDSHLSLMLTHDPERGQQLHLGDINDPS